MDYPVGGFYAIIAKKSTGVLGLAACRTLANLRSPRHCSNLRFPVKQHVKWWAYFLLNA